MIAAAKPKFGLLSRRFLGVAVPVFSRVAIALALIAATTFVCSRLIPVNATTAGFAYLVDILVIATAWGLLEAIVASVVAVLCFNYFFFPPVGTFTIADPQNWVALFAFLVTALIAGQLSARAERRTREAVDRQREMERLYALSRAILLTDAAQPVAKQIARQIAHTFEFPAVALYDRSSGEIHRTGPEDLPDVDDKLRRAALEGTLFQDEARQFIVTAIRLGGEPIGSLAVRGALLSDTALQSLSNLVAVGLERVRGQEAANRAEAARQSEELKSTLLDAIAHEFKTPLTSIKAAATALLSDPAPELRGQRELVTIVDEEADRLARLVTEAIQMARIEGGKLQVNRGLHSASSLIGTTLQQMKPLTASREVRVAVREDLPLVFVDAELIRLAMRQLIDNALKYSAPSTPLVITARGAENSVVLSVADRGPGIPEAERSRIFDKFYRSARNRHQITGAGMGLTIAREILRAHGGDVWVKSGPGQGSEFCLSLPVIPQEKIT